MKQDSVYNIQRKEFETDENLDGTDSGSQVKLFKYRLLFEYKEMIEVKTPPSLPDIEIPMYRTARCFVLSSRPPKTETVASRFLDDGEVFIKELLAPVVV